MLDSIVRQREELETRYYGWYFALKEQQAIFIQETEELITEAQEAEQNAMAEHERLMLRDIIEFLQKLLEETKENRGLILTVVSRSEKVSVPRPVEISDSWGTTGHKKGFLQPSVLRHIEDLISHPQSKELKVGPFYGYPTIPCEPELKAAYIRALGVDDSTSSAYK